MDKIGGSRYETLQRMPDVWALPPIAPKSTQAYDKRQKTRWFRTFIYQALGILWMVPIIGLLVLNFTNYIIGASIWCPANNCGVDPLSPAAILQAQKLNSYDHDALGVFQVVAKALEVWFAFIVTSLVFNVAMIAASNDGLPIGHLFAYIEFIDLRSLVNPIFWTAPASSRNHPGQRSTTVKLYLFAIFTAVMCILANLMGVASAVLVLPTQHWVEMPPTASQNFIQFNSEGPPTGDTVFQGCNASMLAARQYSCALDYLIHLDALIEDGFVALDSSIMNNQSLYSPPQDGSYLPILRELAVTFDFNYTANSQVNWVPNRQVLRSLSADLDSFVNMTQGLPFDPLHAEHNNSLQTILQRQGPIVGQVFAGFAEPAELTIINVADNQDVRCYRGFFVPGTNELTTKCMRVGQGWNSTNVVSSFSVGGVDSSDSVASVNVYFSDKSAYASNSTSQTGTIPPSCIVSGTPPSDGSCNWNTLFPNAYPDALANTSVNLVTLEYGLTSQPSQKIIIQFLFYLGFATYALDTSPASNPLNFVSIDALPSEIASEPPLVVHTDWVLAAFAANQNESLAQDHPAPLQIAAFLQGQSPGAQFTQQATISVLSTLQAMSLVTYSATDPVTDPNRGNPEAEQPTLANYATIFVWAYGTDSRTSKLGVAVALAGLLVVIARTLLGFLRYTTQRSPVELIVAALEHYPQGEMAHASSEEDAAKVRFRVVEDFGGRLRFIPVD